MTTILALCKVSRSESTPTTLEIHAGTRRAAVQAPVVDLFCGNRFSQLQTTFDSMTSSILSAPSPAADLTDESLVQAVVHRITIKHPGYGGNNTLLALPACDGANNSCAHYATVLAACNIFAGNPSDGWLSTSRNSEPRTEPDTEGLIPAGVYFFHALADNENGSEAYAVVPNFRAWRFPHGCIPLLWQQAARNTAAFTSLVAPCTTETCRITNKCLACETSHIVPTSEKSWFADNEMDQYGELGGRTGQDVADCPSNLLRLRRDVHYLWDNLYFSLVPKRTGKSGGKFTWHAHSMSQEQELYEDIHNTSNPTACRPCR